MMVFEADRWIALGFVLLVALQRMGEALYGEYNARQLLRRGAHEAGSGHYPFFYLLHGGWLIVSATWAAFGPLVLSWGLIALYLLVQAGRIWVMTTLGPFWTTRVIVVPQVPLIRYGPYRLLRHPNYWVVAAEVLLLPLALGALLPALVFSVANGGLLLWRIRVENRANAGRDYRQMPD